MAIFSNPDTFKEHKQYVVLLKKALLLVKPGAEKKFLYFKQYAPFGGKKPALVLVDYDSNCVAALAKAGHKPAAEGITTLTEQDELNFEANKGTLKRIRLKKYLATMGSGIKPVFVPAGEVDDDSEGGEPVATGDTAVLPAVGQSPPPPSDPPPPPPDVASADAPPPMDKRMQKKMEFEENEFKRRQLLARIEEMAAAPCPDSHAALKNEALDKARALAKEDRFADGGNLLDGLAAKLRTLAVRPPPPVTPPSPPQPSKFPQQPPPAPPGSAAAPQPQPSKFPKTPPPQPPSDKAKSSPTLSAYMNATSQWKSAKATAEDGVFKLKKAILEACDPELKDIVKAKIDQVNSILAPLDDTIVKKIDEARGDGDEERRAEREVAIGKLAATRLDSLRQHPLAAAADQNPFGTFAIRAPMEEFLTKIATTFGR